MYTRAVIGGALTLLTGAVFVVAACNGGRATAGTDTLARGTWGGENAGAMVGDFRPPVALDQEGRFNVEGSYMLRAFPVAVGPSLPAVFTGIVNGDRLTISVAVNDTVEKKLVSLGPVTVVLGREPRLGPCPICRRPGEMRRGLERRPSGFRRFEG
jgi:hypothetical protein